MLPNHVAVIMDGNGRWAQKSYLPVTEGHRRGAKVAEEIVEYSLKAGIKHLSLFCFSTENWHRAETEVKFLMDLAINYFEKFMYRVVSEGVAVHVVGRRDKLPKSLIQAIDNLSAKNPAEPKLNLYLALNYGGKAELADAMTKILASAPDDGVVTESIIQENLYAPDMPAIDMLVRTSGERRISNFLLWHAAYAELFFVNTLWPDYTMEEFAALLQEYATRKRRFGRRV